MPEVTLLWEGEDSIYWKPGQVTGINGSRVHSCAADPKLARGPPIPSEGHAMQLPDQRRAPNTTLNDRPAAVCNTLNNRSAVVGTTLNNPAAVGNISKSGSIASGLFSNCNRMQHNTNDSVPHRSGTEHDAQLSQNTKNRAVDIYDNITEQPPKTRFSNKMPIGNDYIEDIVGSPEIVAKQLNQNLMDFMKLRGQPVSTANGILKHSNRLDGHKYNPTQYSSEKLRQQRRQNTADTASATPTRYSPPRSIIPRAVDFDDATPIDVIHGRRRTNNKENISPEQSHREQSSDENSFSHTKIYQDNARNMPLVPFGKNKVDSPQNLVNSPDPFLCKIIDGKDQQIFQLHKVLEKVLSNTNTPDRNNLCTLTNQHESPCNINSNDRSALVCKPATRTIGINTDIIWHELVESVQREARELANGKPRAARQSTILKNVQQRSSSVTLQRNTNTSSVRFNNEDLIQRRDDFSREARLGAHQEMKDQVNNEEMARQQDRVDSGNRCNQRHGCTCKFSAQINDSPTRAIFTDGPPQRDLPPVNINDRRDPLFFGNSVDGAGNGYPGGAKPFSMGGHQEVSLTMREVVLTTIQEDPPSPQPSLHCHMPEYPGDTIHQQE